MRDWLRARTAVQAAIVGAVLFLAAIPMAGQQVPADRMFPAYRAPRFPGTTTPDLNGIWETLSTANWDILTHEAIAGPHPELMGAYSAGPPGLGIVEGNELPYRPEALEKKKKNFENRMMAVAPGPYEFVTGEMPPIGEPELKCWMPGTPRMMYMPYPLQIVQTPDFVLMTTEYNVSSRIIRMNWKEEAPIDSFMGWARGHWEGETLVVDVTGFNDQTWFDRAGDFHSDALHVVERYTALSPYHLQYEATIEDPKVFTRPWKMSFILYRRVEKNMQLMEFKCQPYVEEMLFGKYNKQPTR